MYFSAIGTAFRGLSAAAPLKLDQPVIVTTRSSGFPRPQRRGPIEAMSNRFALTSKRCFPRPQRRGPIEAEKVLNRLVAGFVFPRPQRRGPIEALSVPQDPYPGEAGFPRPQRRGPIEAKRPSGPCN